MDARPHPEYYYNEEEDAVRPIRRGPVYGTVMEDKFRRISPQKYQYYDGKSNIIGAPFKADGRRNSNFTSLSFVSNAVFYEHAKNLEMSKKDMYTTTNALVQSKSVERLPAGMRHKRMNENFSPIRPVRSNNNHKVNMTTLDNDLGK